MKIKHTLQTVLTIVVSFDEFKEFLKERNCYEDYAINVLECSLKHGTKTSIDISNPYTWIIDAFIFSETPFELFWSYMDDAWQEILENYKSKYKIDNIEGVLHDDNEKEFKVKKVKFEDFINFLKDHNAIKNYFNYVKILKYTPDEYIEFIHKTIPAFWLDAFLFCDTKEEDFWYTLKELWHKLICYDPPKFIKYTWSINKEEIKKYF